MIGGMKSFLELCTRCGKCIPTCPSFQAFKSEFHSPRARIFFARKGIESKSFETCLLCGRCEVVCPNEVSFPAFYIKFLEKKEGSRIKKFVVQRISNNPLEFLPKKKQYEKDLVKPAVSTTEVVVFFSCGLKSVYPEVLRKLNELFEVLELDWGIAENVVCCGAYMLNLGEISALKQQALKNLEILEEYKGKIVIFCATCYWILKKVYPLIFEGTKLEKRFKELSNRITSGVPYFLNFIEKTELEPIIKEKGLVFHLPCHLTEETKLVKNKLNIKAFCCGSPKLSLLLKGFQPSFKKVWKKHLIGVKTLATFCTGCYLNFKFLIKQPPEVKHWLEVI